MDNLNLKTAAVSLGWELDAPSVFDTRLELGNRYLLRRILAEGGLGQVWLAHDKELQRDVALKQVLAKWANKAHIVEQLRLEAIITGRLEHPGIVPVHDVGRDDDNQLYYCMKLVQGRTLREEFHELGAERWTDSDSEKRRRVYGAYIAICDAIAYAHSRGVIHLDLKPENVILGDYGETQVLDWGLARLLSSDGDAPADGQMRGPVGTPRYMSPEQISGNAGELGPASDIYALGVMLAEIALLEQGHLLPPVEKETLSQTPEKNRNCVRRQLRGPLRSVCLKALSHQPADRYQDARELAAEIQRYLSGDKVRAHREGVFTKVRRFGRKHKTPVLIASLIAIVVAGAWLDRRFRQLENTHFAQISIAEAAGDWLAGRPEQALHRLRVAEERLATGSADAGVRATVTSHLDALGEWQSFENALEKARTLSVDPKRSEEALRALAEARRHSLTTLPSDLRAETVLADRRAAMAELDLLEKWLGGEKSAVGSPSAANLKESSGDLHAVSYLAGRAKQLAGQYEEAARAFELCLLRRPDDFWAMYFLANCMERLGKPESALAAYTACLARQPRSGFLYINRGNVFDQLGNAEAALADYQQAQRMGSNDPRPVYNFGLVLMQREDFEGAIREFDRALAMAPGDVAARVRRAQANRMLGNLHAAKEELEEVVAGYPASADALSELAFVSWNLKDAKRALEMADQATAVEPQRATAAWVRGLWHASREEWPLAAKAYQDALSLEPDNPSLLNNHAGILLNLGKPREAKADLDRALTLKPEHALARWNRIRAAIDLTLAEEALADLRRVERPVNGPAALAQAEFLASMCLKAGRQLPPERARGIIDECIARIAAIATSQDAAFVARLRETPTIAALTRNPDTARRLFSSTAKTN